MGRRLGLLACRCAAAAAAQRPPVLLYHSVGGPGGVSARAFTRQIEYLVHRFRTLVLSDLPETVRAAPEGWRGVACVTFDDGYRDNIEVALPVLEAFGVPATFFLVPSLLGATFRAGHPVMSALQARELLALGHEIGAHSLTHPRLTQVGDEQAQREIAGSKARLEDLLGVEVRAFAYPKGDHDGRVRALVAASGYRVAATVREGLVDRYPDWLALPRISARPSDSMLAFRCKLHPGIDLYERLVRRT